MSDKDPDQKTEAPSEKKLQESHDRGEFAKSAELGVVFSLAAAFGALAIAGPSSARAVAEFTAGIFGQLHTVRFEAGSVPAPMLVAGKTAALALAPLLAASVVAALLSGGIQSGFRLTPDAIGFKPQKLNPISGFGRIFSQRSLVQGGIDLLKLLAIGFCLWIAARTLLADPLFTTPVEAAYLGQFIHSSALLLLARLILALGVIAAIGYGYERYKTHRDMMMTREEVKEERKQAEGSPQVKIALRRMARRLAQRQMLAAVATADVVITNPTHYAVALKYERGIDSAPVIVAKGDNALARRIKALAADHEVPLVENKPVARMLHAMGTVGEAIPAELYQAVAGILAFVYRTHRYYFFRLPARRAAARAG